MVSKLKTFQQFLRSVKDTFVTNSGYPTCHKSILRLWTGTTYCCLTWAHILTRFVPNKACGIIGLRNYPNLKSEGLRAMQCRSPLYCCIEAARQCKIFLARDVSGPGGDVQGLEDAVAHLFLAWYGGGVPPHYDTTIQISVQAISFYTYFLTRV